MVSRLLYKMTEATAQTSGKPLLLLFDRDIIIRAALAEYLRRCGYAVIETARLKEVQEVLRAGNPVDLAFVDIGEDSAEGFRVAQAVRQARPRVRVLIASSIGSAAAEAGDLCEHGPFLTKPYHPSLLERHIKQMLSH
jgi:DNA-binding response OmpR family regulator